ncbi:hypothetical protein [Falsiroseomonas sp.]|uniref:hypothetical protein n=1 Tax=Falsiroseomonas sp. TaxID=2870721 RepID=UPI003F71FA22
MSNRTTFRTSAAALALVAGWMAAAGAMAPARADHDPTTEAAVAAMPHSPAVSNGVAVDAGRDGDHDRFTYEGRAHGNLSAGIPTVVGEEPNGQPDIVYTHPARHAASRAAAVTPAPMAAPASTPAEPVPAQLHGLLTQADQALAANRMELARNKLEQAETLLLNARAEGERGEVVPVRDIAAARAQIAMNNRGAAQREVIQLLRTLGQAS